MLLLLILLLAGGGGAASDTSPDILLTVCGTNKTTNPQTFDVNFVNIMELIHQDITTRGYGAAVSGDPPYIVHGLGQCFGYLSAVTCQLCYAESRVKLPLCLPAVDSRIFLDGCFLRYSDRNISSSTTDESDTSVCGNSSVAEDKHRFRDFTSSLIMNLTTGRVGGGYYRTGRVEVVAGLVVYGAAECWRSLNESGCGECLARARDDVLARCLPAREGWALFAGCYVRYSTKPFYSTATTTSGDGGSSSHRKLGVVIGSVVAAVVAVAVTALVAFWMMRRDATDSNDDEDGCGEFIRSISTSHLSFKYETLCKATDNFNQINKLGHGGYGSVYKGILPDGKEVAVKRLFFNTRQVVHQFFNEVSLISKVQHKNLVKLLGCSIDGPESLLVYEYLCNTSLDKFLFDSFKKNALDWERRFEIIVGIAEGLTYLHSAAEVRIIHRDIKPSNILLDEKFRPKIADFGLARYFSEDQSHLSTGLAGTFGYVAPEYIVHGQLTEKADIYSYGILVLEIITGRKNQNVVATSSGHSLPTLIWQHFNAKTVMEFLDPYLREQCSEEQALKIFHIGLLCAQKSPSLRPSMWKVVAMLISDSKELPLPTQPPFIDIRGEDIMPEEFKISNKYSSSSKTTNSVNEMSVSILQGR